MYMNFFMYIHEKNILLLCASQVIVSYQEFETIYVTITQRLVSYGPSVLLVSVLHLEILSATIIIHPMFL